MKSLKCFLVLLCLGIMSCGKNQKLIDSENTVAEFFKAINQENEASMRKKYPKINTFNSYFKSDSIDILSSIIINDSLTKVKANNYFTNGFGKQTLKEIDLFLTTDSTNTFSTIVDSKGLTDHRENDLYKFALRTGCVKPTDSTDVLKNIKYVEADLFAYKCTLDKLIEFTIGVNVVDWRWEKGYGNSASGKAIVKNNTTFSIPNVKYHITYKNRSGEQITTDDGYVSYDAIGAGQSESFTFYTSYVGNATNASLKLEFDEELIKEYVLQADYNGNEYDEFIAERKSSNDDNEPTQAK